MSEGLRKRTMSGIGWSTYSLIARQFTNIIVMVFLARLLSVRDFGLVSMSAIFISSLQIFNELGFSQAIIQKKEVSDKDLSTCFWVSMIFGFVLLIVCVFSAEYIAILFDEPELEGLVILSSSIFLLSPLFVVQNALIYKDLRFKEQSVIETLQVIIGGMVSIICAFQDFTFYSIVLGGIAGTVVGMLSYWVIVSWRPTFTFSLESFKHMSSFGMRVVGINAIAVIKDKIDFFIIGQRLGAESLGYYTIAFNVMEIFRGRVFSVVLRVLFPAFSEIQDDKEKLRRIYIESIKIFSLVVFPMLIGLIIVSDNLIPMVYGGKWDDAILPLQILCIGAIPYAMTTVFPPIIRSIGLPGVELRAEIYMVLFMIPSVWFGSNYGVLGVSIGVTAASVVYYMIVLVYVKKHINIGIRKQLETNYKSVMASTVMVITLQLIIHINEVNKYLESAGMLIITILLGVLVYILTIYKMDGDIRSLINKYIKRSTV